MYEVLTGLRALGAFTAASSLNPSVPSEFDAVLLKFLASKRDDRYQSVPELLLSGGELQRFTLPHWSFEWSGGRLLNDFAVTNRSFYPIENVVVDVRVYRMRGDSRSFSIKIPCLKRAETYWEWWAFAAEGSLFGTEIDYVEAAMRCRQGTGKWDAHPRNPILRLFPKFDSSGLTSGPAVRMTIEANPRLAALERLEKRRQRAQSKKIIFYRAGAALLTFGICLAIGLSGLWGTVFGSLSIVFFYKGFCFGKAKDRANGILPILANPERAELIQWSYSWSRLHNDMEIQNLSHRPLTEVVVDIYVYYKGFSKMGYEEFSSRQFQIKLDCLGVGESYFARRVFVKGLVVRCVVARMAYAGGTAELCPVTQLQERQARQNMEDWLRKRQPAGTNPSSQPSDVIHGELERKENKESSWNWSKIWILVLFIGLLRNCIPPTPKHSSLDVAYAPITTNYGESPLLPYKRKQYPTSQNNFRFSDNNPSLHFPGTTAITVANFEDYFLKGEYDKAIAEASAAIGHDPGNVKAYLVRAKALYLKGEIDRAITDASEAIHLDNNNLAAYVVRSLAYMAKGDLDNTIFDSSQMIWLDPNNSCAYAIRATAYLQKEKMDKAISDASEAIRLDPKDSYALALRANAYRRKGDLGKAQEDEAKSREIGGK